MKYKNFGICVMMIRLYIWKNEKIAWLIQS